MSDSETNPLRAGDEAMYDRAHVDTAGLGQKRDWTRVRIESAKWMANRRYFDLVEVASGERHPGVASRFVKKLGRRR